MFDALFKKLFHPLRKQVDAVGTQSPSQDCSIKNNPIRVATQKSGTGERREINAYQERRPEVEGLH